LFRPIEHGDALLVDGGISRNLPVDTAKSIGADSVIAGDVGTPLSPLEELTSFLATTGQLSSILIQRNPAEQKRLLTGRDVLIVPALGDEITTADFDKAADEAMPIGYTAAGQVGAQLASLGASEDVYARHRQALQHCIEGPPDDPVRASTTPPVFATP
jgi:NTE family protein